MIRHETLRLICTLGVLLILLSPRAAAEVADSFSNIVTVGQVSLSTHVDRNTANVLQPIELTINVDVPAGTEVDFPELSGTLGPFDIIESTNLVSVPVRGDDEAMKRRWKKRLQLETLKTGDLQIPSLEIVCRRMNQTGSGDETIIRSDPISLRISSVLSESDRPDQPRPIKGTVSIEVEKRTMNHTVWLIAAAAVTLLVVGGWYVLRKRSQVCSSADQARARIEVLQHQWKQGTIDSQQVFCQLAAVTSDFYAQQYHLSSESTTSSELIRSLQNNDGLRSDQKQWIASLMNDVEQIKFSGNVNSMPLEEQLDGKIEAAMRSLSELIETSAKSQPLTGQAA